VYWSVILNLSKSFPERPTGEAPAGSSEMSLRLGWRKGYSEVKYDE